MYFDKRTVKFMKNYINCVSGKYISVFVEIIDQNWLRLNKTENLHFQNDRKWMLEIGHLPSKLVKLKQNKAKA